MKLHQLVWVTDGDTAVGRALIRRLAQDGASLLIGSQTDGQALEEELALVKAQGLQAMLTAVNLTDAKATAEMLVQAEERMGPVSVLIHNHDRVHRASVESCEEQDFIACMRDNAKTAFVCTQAAGALMAKRQSGSILYLSSIHAHKPTGSAFAYSAAKGAVHMLAKEAALALGRSGIRVNTVEIGALAGDQERFASEISTLYRDFPYKVPQAEPVTEAAIAELAAFLASDASRHLNGADIRLDGGFVLHYMDVKMKQPPPATGGEA